MQYRKISLKQKTNTIKSSTKDLLLDELLSLRDLVEQSEIDAFLNPSKNDFISPYAFSDMQKAKEKIIDCIEKGQKILVWGDFDCDGVTSASILYKALKELGANVITFIPDRLLHGHGLNNKELIKLISKEQIKLVITVDCATSNVSEVNLLKGLNVATIITDHHSTDTALPDAYAIINPQVKGSLKDDLNVKDITSLSYNSGSTIAYKLAMAILENNDNEDLKQELQIIASCGAIADVVPLIGENRAMVKVALEVLNAKKENSHKGIWKLLSKNLNDKDITSTDVAFILAPRINAVGRLANAKLSFDFLVETNDSALDIIIEKLDNYNKIRQSKCTQIYEDVEQYLNKNKHETKNPAIILINPDWHIGIIGIVASKIVEQYNKPCFLMTVDENNNARCSIRSNDLINVYQVLKENESLFQGFGGHKLAGGCSFCSDDFDKVKSALLKTISELKNDTTNDNTLYADMELQKDDIELNILDSINKLEPFGQNNEPPLFAMFGVNLDEYKFIGKDSNHLRLVFSKDDKKLQCVKWSESDFKIPLNSKCDIAFYPRLNVFNNIESVQLELVDVYCENVSIQSGDFKIFDHRKKTGILSQIASYLEREDLDIGIWAKTLTTKETLSKYENIKANFIDTICEKRGLMFFDYPSNYEELNEILTCVKPQKIHLMNNTIDENLENYIKQINGMIKYCANKLQGQIDLVRISLALGVSANFVQITLEILEDINSIQILDIDKIKYLKPFNYEDFKKSSMFEVLKEEFDNILNFKKSLLNCDIKEFEQLIKSGS